MLGNAKINLVAALGYTSSRGKEAFLYLVADDATAARDALRKAGYKRIKAVDVLMVPLANKPGALQDVLAKLAAAKIGVDYAYATAGSLRNAVAIIRVKSMIDKALKVLS